MLGGSPIKSPASGAGHNFDAEIWQNHARIAVTPAMPSQRACHAIALAFEDGAVLTSGANVRSWDHSIYEPKYCQLGYRPNILSLSTTQFAVGTTNIYRAYYDVQTPSGEEDPVEKVVLIRPGAFTHHVDMDARYIELEQAPMPYPPPPGTFVDFYPPPSENIAPKGWYMLVLVTYAGVPSVASWVQLA